MHRGRHGLITASKVLPRRTASIGPLPLSAAQWRRYSLQHGPPKDIAILGGGISGLATAYYITRELPDARVTIYEASNRLGGWVSSSRVPVQDGTVLFEAGPRTLRPSSNGVLSASLLQDLDLAKDAIFPHKISPAAQNRYLYYPNHLVRMPHPAFGIVENFWSLIREPVFQGAIWSGLTEILKDARDSSIQDESVGAFFSRRFQRTLVDRILSGVIHGIYAGDVWQLSAKSLFSGPWRDEVQTGSVFNGLIKSRADGLEVTRREAEYLQEMKNFNWDPLLKATLAETVAFTLKDGLGMIPDRLARHLMGTGTVQFQMETPVERLTLSEENDNILVHTKSSNEPVVHDTAIAALRPEVLNWMHKDDNPTLIPDIPYVTVMTVNLYYRTPNLNPPGFGYLIPQATPFENNPERALGVVFDTAYSPSPSDVDPNNWAVQNVGRLQLARERGELINVNDFAWYNMPDTPNIQDNVPERGSKLTVMLGGHWWDGWPSYPDEQEGLALAKSLLARHLGINEEPEAWRVNLQEDCIPQYTVGHEDRLKTAHNNLWREYKGKLRVAGNWQGYGVGLNDCLRSAWEVVRSLKNGRDGTGLEHVGTSDYVRLKAIRSQQTREED